MPSLTAIVITNYNYGKYLGAAIDSAVKQSLPADIILVVDNASTDNSVEVARGRKNVIWIGLDKNYGPSKARNAGIEYLQTNHPDIKYVGFLDADDFYHPDKIKKSVEVLEKLPFVNGVYSDYDEYDLRTHATRREFKYPFDLNIFRQACIVATNSVFRIQSILQVGGYDETWPNCEDYELYARMVAHGIFWHLPESLFTYRLHGKNITIERREEVLQRTDLVRKRLNGVAV